MKEEKKKRKLKGFRGRSKKEEERNENRKAEKKKGPRNSDVQKRLEAIEKNGKRKQKKNNTKHNN